MSTVSNRFYVEAIDDGSTLHGQLLSTKALTQAWNGSAAIPDWTQAANQPIVFVDLLSGSQKVTPDAGGTWYYNNQEIERLSAEEGGKCALLSRRLGVGRGNLRKFLNSV